MILEVRYVDPESRSRQMYKKFIDSLYADPWLSSKKVLDYLEYLDHLDQDEQFRSEFVRAEKDRLEATRQYLSKYQSKRQAPWRPWKRRR